jgi:hypothetical protein
MSLDELASEGFLWSAEAAFDWLTLNSLADNSLVDRRGLPGNRHQGSQVVR